MLGHQISHAPPLEYFVHMGVSDRTRSRQVKLVLEDLATFPLKESTTTGVVSGLYHRSNNGGEGVCAKIIGVPNDSRKIVAYRTQRVGPVSVRTSSHGDIHGNVGRYHVSHCCVE